MAVDRCDVLCLDLPRAEELRARAVEAAVAAAAARRAQALADPTRLTVADALGAGGPLCVCDLAWIVGRSQALVSHHLRVLREAGLARSERDGKLVMYELTDDGAALVGRLLAEVAAP